MSVDSPRRASSSGVVKRKLEEENRESQDEKKAKTREEEEGSERRWERESARAREVLMTIKRRRIHAPGKARIKSNSFTTSALNNPSSSWVARREEMCS